MKHLVIISLALLCVCPTLLVADTQGKEPIFLNIAELFTSGDHPRTNFETRTRLKSQIQTAISEGRTPLAIAPVWVFPKSLGAPRVPPTGILTFEGIEPVRIYCIPDFDTEEYKRWAAARDGLYERMAADFPEVTEWLVGFEPDQHILCDCSGKQLEVDSYIRFAVDTLAGIRQAVKSLNPKLLIIAHFLGTKSRPLQFGERIVQPAEIVSRIAAEIAGRGGNASDYFDCSVASLYPGLLTARSMEDPVAVDLDSTTLSSTGWNTYWTEEFGVATEDLVSSYSTWVKILTDERSDSNPEGSILLTDTPVSSGVAHVSNEQYPGAECNRYGFDPVSQEYIPAC